MPCPNCGGTLIGDGVTLVRHCENVDLDALDCRPEPDAMPVYCEGDEMKLSNCGRCGLEPVELAGRMARDNGAPFGTMRKTWGCPVHDANEECGSIPTIWNAAQFAARTERINAAAVLGWAKSPACNDDYILELAGMLIDAQDAAARVRWAEMRGE